jgi:hypothetical protein
MHQTHRTFLLAAKPYGDLGGVGVALRSLRTPVALRTRGNSTAVSMAKVRNNHDQSSRAIRGLMELMHAIVPIRNCGRPPRKRTFEDPPVPSLKASSARLHRFPQTHFPHTCISRLPQ